MMLLNKKIHLWTQPIFSFCATVTLCFPTIAYSFSNGESLVNFDSKGLLSQAKTAVPEAKDGGVEPAKNEEKKSSEASAQPQTPKESTQQPEGWIFQLRTNLGVAKYSSSETFKSDRLGAALFAGGVLPDLEIPLGFLESVPLTVGVAYHSFSGVDTSKNDSSWALQAIGSQVRMVFDLGLPYDLDLAAQTGLAAQRLVSETHLTRQETVKWGAAFTGGTFVRWPMTEFVHVVGGADVVLGSAMWFAASLGVETNL